MHYAKDSELAVNVNATDWLQLKTLAGVVGLMAKGHAYAHRADAARELEVPALRRLRRWFPRRKKAFHAA